MDRQALTQVIAMLMVLSLLVPWIPSKDPVHPFGLGGPALTLHVDENLSRMHAQGDPDLGKAYLRGMRGLEPDRYFRQWRNFFTRVNNFREQAAEDPAFFVQFKNMARNEQWPLTYYLYPIPVVGDYYERGSRLTDPTLPGATVFPGKAIDVAALPPEEQERIRELRADNRRRKGKPVTLPNELSGKEDDGR